jgi:hypothetical protein
MIPTPKISAFTFLVNIRWAFLPDFFPLSMSSSKAKASAGRLPVKRLTQII